MSARDSGSSFADHFSGHAREYAQLRPRYSGAMFDYLASLAPARDLAWDCGTGNGQAALALAERFLSVVATDASAEQIRHAFRHERIEYRVEPAEATSVDDRSVDLVTVGTAAHWFDFDRFYMEIRRVAKPGGVLAVWTYHFPHSLGRDVDRAVERFYHETLRGFWPAEIRHLEEHYRTLPFPFDEIEPPAFTMEADWTLDDLMGFMSSWSASRRYREHHGRDPVVEVGDELRAAWGRADTPRRISWPLHFRIGRVFG